MSYFSFHWWVRNILFICVVHFYCLLYANVLLWDRPTEWSGEICPLYSPCYILYILCICRHLVRPLLAKSRTLCRMLLVLGFTFMQVHYCFSFLRLRNFAILGSRKWCVKYMTLRRVYNKTKFCFMTST